MRKWIAIIGIIGFVQTVSAQVWYTKNGYISFYSHTSAEDIRAENFEVVSFLDAGKEEFRFQVLIKGFQFPKAAMQQHFNSASYMNSDSFPKAEFKGIVADMKPVNLKKDGVYKVQVSGDMTMHGKTQKIKEPGTITVKDGKVSANSVFKIMRSDFNITTPSFTAAKIAQQIEVTVKCDYELYQKN